MAPDAPAPPDVRCASHQGAPAVALCARCGSFLCGDCVELREEAAYCAACVDFLRHQGPPSRGVQACIVLGVFGLLCFPVLLLAPLVNGLAAGFCLWVSGVELRRIQRGERPARGRTQARVARFLGWFNLGLMLLWAGGVVYVGLVGRG